MDDEELWELAGYVKGGSHRFDVFCYLARNGATIPSETADELGKTQQRVYDAQEELKREELIELKVPEDKKKGRLHGLTERGRELWDFLVEEGIADENNYR